MANDVAAGPRASIWEDFVDILFAPAQVFERRRCGNILPPLLVVTVAMTVLHFVTAPLIEPLFEAEWARQVEQLQEADPRLTGPQVELIRSVARTFGGLVNVLGVPVGILLTGAVLWTVGKLLGARGSLRPAVLVATYATVPRILEQVAHAVQTALMDPDSVTSRFSVSLGPARFLDREVVPPVLLELAGALDAFTIWTTVLLAIGLRVTGRISARKAAAGAGIVWTVLALSGVLAGLVGRR